MTQPQEVLRVTEDGQFIWHPEADVMLKEGNFSHALAMQHMLIALRKQRQWQGLTDEEIQTEWVLTPQNDKAEGIWFGRRIEAKLKEKNT